MSSGRHVTRYNRIVVAAASPYAVSLRRSIRGEIAGTMQLCTEVPTWRVIGSYTAAVPAAFVIGIGLFALLRSWRRSNMCVRFATRVLVIGGGCAAFGLVMRVLGGPCVFSGPMRGGGYDSAPTGSRDIFLFGLVAGVVGAVMVPIVAKAKGVDIKW